MQGLLAQFFSVIPEYASIYLNVPSMSEHGWILLNVREYSENVWISLYLCNGFQYVYASLFWIFDRVLNMPQALNIQGFWIYCNTEYKTVTYGSEYPWICLNHHEHLNMSEYHRTNRLPNIIWYHLFVTLLHCQTWEINYLFTVKCKSNVQDAIRKKNHLKYRNTFVGSSERYDN